MRNADSMQAAARAGDSGAARPSNPYPAVSGTRILVVRLSAMGDVLHALPAVAALRRGLPEAEIGWVIEERWQPLLAASGAPLSGPLSSARPLVHCVHTVNTRAWRAAPLSRDTRRTVVAAVRELRARNYDVAVDFQGTIKSATLAVVSGARQRIGFAHTREKPASVLYSRRVEARGTHIVEQNLSLAAAITGRTAPETVPELPLDRRAECACEAELTRRHLREFAILSPGAGWGAKQWPAEGYAEVARALGKLGLRSLVNFGPGEEALAAAIAAQSGGAAEPLPSSNLEGERLANAADRVSALPYLIAFTRRARLFLGGDTGPMHLAAALRIPVVAIFGPTDPARNGPYGTRSIVLRSSRSVTSYSHRDRSDAGLLAIAPADVVAAAEKLLAGNGGAGA